ncbi:MAG: hypothetical protein JXA92_03480 [candidate division Zixibacteria bacterium]|nr:hypothetical protein [candidate division Zixibacteria bacterium]
MGSGGEKKPYNVVRRNRKRRVKKPRDDGRSVVFVCNEALKEVWIHADEVKHTGLITFVTKSGKEIRRTLVYTWFPPGIWKVKFPARKKTGETDGYAQVVGSENVDPALENRLRKMTAGQEFYLYRFVIKGNYPYDQMVECLYQSAVNKEITFRVTYTVGGNGDSDCRIKDIPLSDDYLKALGVEMVARIYMVMLEHFAGINIDERIVIGGIDRKEYQQIIKLKSKDPSLTPRVIARVTTQAAYEFGKLGVPEWEYLLLMLEAILYQRKRKNPLATNNQLEIGRGLMRNELHKLIEDFGIKRRGESVLLLYDKFGEAIPAYVGFMDSYYRNLDLDKVPMIKIELGESGFASFMRVLEQTFAYPTRETYVFMASIADFYKFIIEEVYRLYGGEIQKKVMEMLPMAIGFFIIHAVIGTMARRGNPYAAALLVIAKAVGWIMNVDMGIATAGKMATAGRHFAMMEKIHRRQPQEKGKEKLTQLSLYHLEVGTRYLIDAMSDLIAQGVFIVGGKLGQKVAGKATSKIKQVKDRNKAKLELTIQDGKIVKIRAIKGKNIIEIQTQKPVPVEPPARTGAGKGGAGKGTGGGKKGGGKAAKGTGTGKKGGGAERTTPTGEKLKAMDSPPLEESGLNMGRRQQTKTPGKAKTVTITEFKYTTVDAKSRPASSEAVSGLPEAHLKIAVELAAQQKVMVIFRTTNPRGVQHILTGHPPKGKDLIALNTDKITGKVTAKTSKQWRIAMRAKKGYYILQKDGFAYNRHGQKITGPDGKPMRYDMQAKGKFGELTNRPGQVIDPATRKAVVGDYDLQDVIQPHSQGRNLAAVPETLGDNVSNPIIDKFANAFNSQLQARGDTSRIVHGADAQFMQYKHFRKNAFKGDAVGILPDGRVVYFSEAGLGKFYKSIGRSRLNIGKRARLKPYKKKTK